MARNQATGQEAGAVYVSVMPSGQGFSKAMDNDLDGAFTGAASRGTKTFGQMFRRVAAAGAAILATLGLSKLIKNTVSLGVEYNTLEQTSRAAFTTILGSSEAAAAMMGEIREFAKTSPFPRQAFIEATRQMLGFGFAAKDIIPTLDIIQDAVAAMGGGADEIALLTDVFSKIKSTGRVMADDLNRLSQVGINAWEILAQASGKSIDQMRKDVGEGSVDAATAIAQLTAGMESRFGGAAANIKNTWVGATDRIKGAWRDIASALVAPFIDPEGGGYAVKWANIVADSMRAFESSPGLDALQEKLRDIAESMDPFIVATGEAFKLLGEENGWQKFVDAMTEISPLFGFIATVAESLKPVLPALSDAMVGVANALLAEGVMDSLVQLITEVLPPLVDLLVAISPLIPPLAQLLTAILVPAISETAEHTGATVDVLELLYSFIASGFNVTKFIDDAHKIWDTLGPIGDFAKDVWDNLLGMSRGMYLFFESLGTNIGKAFGGAVGVVKNYLNSIIDAVNRAIRGLNGITSTVGKAFGFSLQVPTIPRLADSGTVLPRPGGTLILAAEAGRAESVVDTGKLNDLMDAAANGGGGSGITNHWTLNEVTDAVGTAQAVFRRQNMLGAV